MSKAEYAGSIPATRSNNQVWRQYAKAAYDNAMYDPRAIANMIIEEGERTGRPVTNLALQKLLYFAHALFLIERKEPLVSGYFEAWQYGPVHPTVYNAFKEAGDQPISFRAMATDPLSGRRSEISTPDDSVLKRHITRLMVQYGDMTPGRLVDVSHAPKAPWHFVVEKAKHSVSLGLRITDDIIIEHFKHHKVSVAELPKVGEPGDDSPILARNGSSKLRTTTD